MSQKMKYAVAGALAGAANGFFGAGGGLFLVPLFTRWTGLDTRRALASSIAVVLPLSAISAGVYWAKSGMDWAGAAPYLLGGLLGGFFGGRLFKKIPTRILRRGFALLLIFGGIRSVTG